MTQRVCITAEVTVVSGVTGLPGTVTAAATEIQTVPDRFIRHRPEAVRKRPAPDARPAQRLETWPTT